MEFTVLVADIAISFDNVIGVVGENGELLFNGNWFVYLFS